ncbi:hypothetical protein LIER_06289 [Lithospermum erythrorhizon]|uniref:Uncharacterized protein n=1 Tax=Lithospermum erythrorhizon TaxID=34254 RepID=A0AAV3P8D2_LITER
MGDIAGEEILGALEGLGNESSSDPASRHALSLVHRQPGEPVGSRKPHGHHGEAPSIGHKDSGVYDCGHDEKGAYNGIIGRPALSPFEAMVTSIHLKMKFPRRLGRGRSKAGRRRPGVLYGLYEEGR